MSLDVKFVQLRIFLMYLENIDPNILNSCQVQNREYVTTNTISALVNHCSHFIISSDSTVLPLRGQY